MTSNLQSSCLGLLCPSIAGMHYHTFPCMYIYVYWGLKAMSHMPDNTLPLGYTPNHADTFYFERRAH